MGLRCGNESKKERKERKEKQERKKTKLEQDDEMMQRKGNKREQGGRGVVTVPQSFLCFAGGHKGDHWFA